MPDSAEIARDFLRQAVAASGLKPGGLAKKAGVAPSTITRPLNDPEFKFTPKLATLQKIATASGVSLPQDLGLATPEVSLTELPMIGQVQAGAWLAVDETAQDEPQMLNATLDRRYPHARQWLREVRGDSMTARQIYDGDLAHLVELTGSGVNLNTGMIVEVTRTRAGGLLREVTLKEVEVTPSALLLWPRSSNPRWVDPIRLDEPGDDGDLEVQVTGLLISTIRRFG